MKCVRKEYKFFRWAQNNVQKKVEAKRPFDYYDLNTNLPRYRTRKAYLRKLHKTNRKAYWNMRYRITYRYLEWFENNLRQI